MGIYCYIVVVCVCACVCSCSCVCLSISRIKDCLCVCQCACISMSVSVCVWCVYVCVCTALKKQATVVKYHVRFVAVSNRIEMLNIQLPIKPFAFRFCFRCCTAFFHFYPAAYTHAANVCNAFFTTMRNLPNALQASERPPKIQK